MRVAEAVAEAVRSEGVERVFGLLGEGNIAVLEHLTELPGVTWYAARREDAAVCMADGHARRSGSTGFAAITHGPGVGNAVTALTEATRARTPLVVLAGDTPREEHRHPQAADERAFIAPTGAGIHEVRSPATAVDDVAIAFGRARRELRPVVLLLGSDLAEEAYRGPPQDSPRARAESRRTRLLPDDDAVAEAIAVLAAARRPVVLAGRGAVMAGAREVLAGLSGALGAGLVTSLLARGYFAGEPADAGMAGGFGSDAANALLAEADVVVAAGTSLDAQTTKDGALLAGARVLRIDTDPAPAGAPDDELALVGDAAATAAALLTGVRADPPADLEQRRDRLLERLAVTRAGAVDADGGRLDARTVAAQVGAAVPEDRTVVVDLGYFTAEACRHVDVPAPRRFLFPLNFGSIGLALATAAGAATCGNAPTVALVGDGGLMQAVGELDTISRLDLPVVVVVFNDAAYGIEYHALRLRERDSRLAIFDDIDFAAVARAFGLDAATVRSSDDLRRLRPRLRGLTGPFLVDAKIDRTVETDWLRDLVAAGWHRH